MTLDMPDLRETAGAPVTFWAILTWDDTIAEKRVAGIYTDPGPANADALAMQGGSTFVTVEPWLIFTAPRYGSDHEPAWEASDEDFDVAIQGDDL